LKFFLLSKQLLSNQTTQRNENYKLQTLTGPIDLIKLPESNRYPDALISDLSSIVAATDNFSPTNKLGDKSNLPQTSGTIPRRNISVPPHSLTSLESQETAIHIKKKKKNQKMNLRLSPESSELFNTHSLFTVDTNML
jgi:hypothetical protein